MSFWPEKAEAVAAALAAERIDWPERVEEPVGVGCSGGADSVCLLLLAWVKFGNSLRVLHLNHGLRGADADADAVFVQELASGLDLAFISDKLEQPPVDASEAWLRERRLDFYRRSGCATVLLGHHADDVAETLLMRLTRGSGTEGLAAPLPVQVFSDRLALVRPLLKMPKASILDALREHKIPWCEDASNAAPDYFRNRIRSEVLPALRKAAPGNAWAGISRSHRLLAEDAEALNTWLNGLGLSIECGKPLSLRQLTDKPAALWRRAVQRWLALHRLHERLSAAAVDDLLAQLQAGQSGQLSAGAGQWLVFNREQLVLEKHRGDIPVAPWPVCFLRPGLTLWLPRGGALRLERVTLNEKLRQHIFSGNIDNCSCLYLVTENPAQPLIVRQWRDGDRYRPLGAPGSRKLQDCFTDAKIPVLERKRLPVVCSPTGQILWTPGLPPADSAKIEAHTQWALRLTYAPH